MTGRLGGHHVWNKRSVEEHLRRGTYRRDRHGPIPQPPRAGPEDEPPWQPDPADLAALGPEGRQLVGQFVGVFLIDVVQGTLLLEAARLKDDATRWRAAPPDDKAAQRLAVSCVRTYTALLLRAGLR